MIILTARERFLLRGNQIHLAGWNTGKANGYPAVGWNTFWYNYFKNLGRFPSKALTWKSRVPNFSEYY